MFFDDALREAARDTLKTACMDDQRSHLRFLVETIRAKAGVSNREIEQACGVTPTYLSHLLKGRKEAGEPLIGLLEAFAIHPSEVRRRLNRATAYDTDGVQGAIPRDEMLTRDWNALAQSTSRS
jgi:transcriptional regulator with XRE-family HTH domain